MKKVLGADCHPERPARDGAADLTFLTSTQLPDPDEAPMAIG